MGIHAGGRYCQETREAGSRSESWEEEKLGLGILRPCKRPPVSKPTEAKQDQVGADGHARARPVRRQRQDGERAETAEVGQARRRRMHEGAAPSEADGLPSTRHALPTCAGDPDSIDACAPGHSVTESTSSLSSFNSPSSGHRCRAYIATWSLGTLSDLTGAQDLDPSSTVRLQLWLMGQQSDPRCVMNLAAALIRGFPELGVKQGKYEA